MTITIVFGVLGLLVSIIGISIRVILSRRNLRDTINKEALEASDDIRDKALEARIEYETEIPKMDDDTLDAGLNRLRRAIKAARKTN